MASPDKNFFSIRLKKAGLDPITDVEFKQFPGPLLPVARGEGRGRTRSPTAIRSGSCVQKDGASSKCRSNLDGEYASRACCIVGVRGSLIRDDKPAAAAIAGADRGAGISSAHQPGRSRRDLSALCAAARPNWPISSTLAKYHTHASPSGRRRSEEGARALCRGAEAASRSSSLPPIRRNSPSASMPTC